jgi:hypothetical protein
MRATLHSGSREFRLLDTKSAIVNTSLQKLPGSLEIARLKPFRKRGDVARGPPSERSALQLPAHEFNKHLQPSVTMIPRACGKPLCWYYFAIRTYENQVANHDCNHARGLVCRTYRASWRFLRERKDGLGTALFAVSVGFAQAVSHSARDIYPTNVLGSQSPASRHRKSMRW